MKKLIFIILTSIVIMGGGYFIYQYFYGGTDYYTKINQEPINIEENIDDEGVVQGKKYTYKLNSFNDKGESLEIQFDSFYNRPLKQNAYLKVLVNKKTSVISWEEVSKDDIPQNIEDKLQ